jgi:hypothetical protein
LFKEMLLIDGYPSAVNKLWAWGNTGLLKQSARAESSTPSPVGPVILFDPDQLPANTPTPPRMFAQEDNIRVAQTTPAFHNFGVEMAVEALVYLDTTERTQSIVGKGWSSKGFSLAYLGDPDYGMAWDIGTGTGYARVRSYVTIGAGQWYYVVAAHSAQAQTLWVNGVAQTGPAVATPVWGVNDLRLGAPSAGDGSFLDGRLGGYVALLTTAPTGAYVQASYRNFIVNDFITYGPEEIGP